MAYTKQTWVDNETLVNADKLSHIEDGIAEAQDSADTAQTAADEVLQYVRDYVLGGSS